MLRAYLRAGERIDFALKDSWRIPFDEWSWIRGIRSGKDYSFHFRGWDWD